MLVSFNPMINTGASQDAAFMNFLRCVKAIATAAAGTSSLTVNPFTNNTGTIDGTRNCIVSIMANAEAGGWTESASSNVIQSGSFTTIGSMSTFGQYKFDAYNSSGKGSYPYNKLCFTSQGGSSGAGTIYQQNYGEGAYNNGYGAYYPMMTFGSSTTTDWTDTRFIPTGASAGTNQTNYGYGNSPSTYGSGSSYQNLSFSLGSEHAYNSAQYYDFSRFNVTGTDRIFYMAVTANYCILWETSNANNYISGYSTYLSSQPSGVNYNYLQAYGTLWYGGLRETQAWENTLSNNPPWVCLQQTFTRATSGSGTSPYPFNSIAAFMATYADNGVINPTTQIYVSSNGYTTPYFNNLNLQLFGYMSGSSPQSGLLTPFVSRDWANAGTMGTYYTNQHYMPTVDPVTGTAVPPAFPIVARRVTSGSWNPGGAIRGLYRSLSMPYTSMQNYFAPGQTYNIYNPVSQVTDTYMPIIFNEDMFLVRFA